MRLMVNLIYDTEYKGYVVDVPELPGCMSQGKTNEAALKNVKEAIELYLEVLQERCESIPQPKYRIGKVVVAA